MMIRKKEGKLAFSLLSNHNEVGAQHHHLIGVFQVFVKHGHRILPVIQEKQQSLICCFLRRKEATFGPEHYGPIQKEAAELPLLLSERGDSNARPLRPERSALPTALLSDLLFAVQN